MKNNELREYIPIPFSTRTNVSFTRPLIDKYYINDSIDEVFSDIYSTNIDDPDLKEKYDMFSSALYNAMIIRKNKKSLPKKLPVLKPSKIDDFMMLYWGFHEFKVMFVIDKDFTNYSITTSKRLKNKMISEDLDLTSLESTEFDKVFEYIGKYAY